MPALWCSASSMSQQSDALVPSVLDTISRCYAHVSHWYLFATHPYYFGDRFASIPNRAFHPIPLATLTDLCYQTRAMPSSLAFPPLYCPFIPFFGTCTVPLHTLDDDVVVTLCLATWSPSPSSPPYLSISNRCPALGVALVTPTPSTREFSFVHTATTY